MVRHKSQPLKKPRRVALMPASSLSSPLVGNNPTPGQQRYNDVVDTLAAKYGVGDEDPLKKAKPKRKRAPRKKKKYTSPEFVITKKDLKLIEAGERLQDRYRHKMKHHRKVTKRTVKRAGRSATKSMCFDKRTTLQSLLRKIPDARKPLSQWLK